jgi:hypothetical protein
MPRMEFADLTRWTSYLTLHEEFQAGLRAYRLSNEALRTKLTALEQNNAAQVSFPQPLQDSALEKLRRILRKLGRPA